jgi:MFS family permease
VTSTSRRPRLHAVPLPRGAGAGWFAAAGLVNAVGTGFFYPFSLLFFHRVQGLPFTTIGAGLTVTMLAVLPVLTRVGRLIDRFGPRPVLVAAAVLRAVAFVGFVTVPGLGGFLVFNTMVAVCNRTEHAATPVLATALAPPTQTGRWLALSRTVLNAGIGLGALVGGLVVDADRHGFTVIALVDAASFLGAALLYLPLRARAQPAGEPTRSEDRPWQHRRFRRVVILNSLLWLVAIAVETGMPTYLVVRLGQPAFTASLLFAINTALLTVLQLPIADRLTGRNPWRVFAGGAVLCLGLLGALAAATHLPDVARLGVLVIAMIGYTFGELMVSQARLLLLTSIAPATERGTYLAFNQIFIGIATALAPAFVTLFLDHRPELLWWTLAGCALLGSVGAVRQPRPRQPDQLEA